MPAKKKTAKKTATTGKKKVAKKSAAKKAAPKKAPSKKAAKKAAPKKAAKKAPAKKPAAKKAATKAKKAAPKKAAAKKGPAQAKAAKPAATKTPSTSPRAATKPAAAVEITRVADGAPVVSMAAALGAPTQAAPRAPRSAQEARARSAAATDDPAVGLAQVVAALALDKKGTDVVLLKVTDLTSYTDVFVCASAPSERQVQAIARHADDELRKAGKHPIGVEGMDQGRWVLVDFGSVVLHVFLESARPQYDLEGFWSEAPRLDVDEAEGLAVLQRMRDAREAQLAAAAD